MPRARRRVRPCSNKQTALERVKRKIQKSVWPSNIPTDGFAWAVTPVSPGVELYVMNENLGFILSSDLEGEALGLDFEFALRIRAFWSI